MAVIPENQIKIEMKAHIDQEGSAYSNWYVGITNNVVQRLFGDHGVNKENSWWIYRTAVNSDTARRIEQYFLNLGIDGGSGGGDYTANIVYAYKKTSNTRP